MPALSGLFPRLREEISAEPAILRIFRRYLLLAAALLSVASCLSGTFRFEAVDRLTIGATTEKEVLAAMGTPRAQQERTTDGRHYALWRYVQTATWYQQYGSPIVFNQRHVDLEFVEGVLNASYSESWIDTDKRTLDLANEQNLLPGSTTRDEVQQILGLPHGQASFPTVLRPYVSEDVSGTPADATTAWSYAQHNGAKGVLLVVYFDSGGTLVGKVTRTQDGDKSTMSQSW